MRWFLQVNIRVVLLWMFINFYSDGYSCERDSTIHPQDSILRLSYVDSNFKFINEAFYLKKGTFYILYLDTMYYSDFEKEHVFRTRNFAFNGKFLYKESFYFPDRSGNKVGKYQTENFFLDSTYRIEYRYSSGYLYSIKIIDLNSEKLEEIKWMELNRHLDAHTQLYIINSSFAVTLKLRLNKSLSSASYVEGTNRVTFKYNDNGLLLSKETVDGKNRIKVESYFDKYGIQIN